MLKLFRRKKNQVSESENQVKASSEESLPIQAPQLLEAKDYPVLEESLKENEAITSVSTAGGEKPLTEVHTPPVEKQTLFQRLRSGLTKSRQKLSGQLGRLLLGKKQIDEDLLEELETLLLQADIGLDVTDKIIASLTESLSRKQLQSGEAVYQTLAEQLNKILKPVEKPLMISSKESHTPFVILMVGVNGAGKTTTIGKLAKQLSQKGHSVMLAAGDTFRAAAVEQLKVWGERNEVPVIAQGQGADSASVIFDALQSAKARGVDVLIADTAGRLHNKEHLMQELAKIVRVMKKIDAQAPHEIMLVLDASNGQNALSQAKVFHEAVGVTSVTLTKFDGTAKGGILYAIADKLKLPIRYIGVGEKVDDLQVFNADEFTTALLAQD